ncbi:MAG: hypothetical protein ABJL67_11985 [Sulfitobacter sp.]
MTALYDYFSSAVTFVHIATLCYVAGLLTRRELLLRMFLLVGTAFYILYYYNIAENPLWEAIGTSVLIGSANVPVIYRIFQERSTWGMPEDMLSLYRAFPNFNPGQFRKLMSRAEIIHQQDADRMLLEQGVTPRYLFLTTTDGFILQRNGQNAELGPGNFLGEISFLLGGAATATVIARPGTSYVSWDLDDLRHLMAKSEPISNAVSVLLNRDVARKLAVSFPTSGPPSFPKSVT